jgi:endonuclease YncB( thermonuclease family)
MRNYISRPVLRWPVAFALAFAGSLAITAGLGTGATSARNVAFVAPDAIVAGPARVIDGDTIDIGGTRIRLEGIDAPEAGQTCMTGHGAVWDCGNAATRVMAGLTQGRTVECASRGRDKYGRVLATCFVGGLDVNREMIKRGYAWAFVRYSRRYVEDEALARTAKLGIWQGAAIPAWDYRARRWTEAAPIAPQGCAIKGNVSRTGQIYHMPWSPWYEKVVMRAEKGTRWFCSEADAISAGWRPAMMR